MAVSQITTASMLHLMREDENPKEEILSAIGDISDIELFGTNILLGIYIQSSTTKAGLITSSMSRESIYQGKVGLVLKLPVAPFPEKILARFGGKPPQVGDWVTFNVGNADQLSVMGTGSKNVSRLADVGLEIYSGWPCRRIPAEYIEERVKNPRSIV
jgi:hypothetical protein